VTFRVPHLAAGRYHLVALAPAGTARRLLPVSGTFKIVNR
jgi:hypothetical protein